MIFTLGNFKLLVSITIDYDVWCHLMMGHVSKTGHDITFEKMENVREQQERLARLHFDLMAQQDIYGHETEEGRKFARENMSKLMGNLQQLSIAM